MFSLVHFATKQRAWNTNTIASAQSPEMTPVPTAKRICVSVSPYYAARKHSQFHSKRHEEFYSRPPQEDACVNLPPFTTKPLPSNGLPYPLMFSYVYVSVVFFIFLSRQKQRSTVTRQQRPPDHRAAVIIVHCRSAQTMCLSECLLKTPIILLTNSFQPIKSVLSAFYCICSFAHHLPLRMAA